MVENEKGKLIENSIAEMSNGSPREAGLVTLTPSGADEKKLKTETRQFILWIFQFFFQRTQSAQVLGFSHFPNLKLENL